MIDVLITPPAQYAGDDRATLRWNISVSLETNFCVVTTNTDMMVVDARSNQRLFGFRHTPQRALPAWATAWMHEAHRTLVDVQQKLRQIRQQYEQYDDDALCNIAVANWEIAPQACETLSSTQLRTLIVVKHYDSGGTTPVIVRANQARERAAQEARELSIMHHLECRTFEDALDG